METAMHHDFPLAETFGIAAPDHLTVPGFADGSHPLIPSRKDYIFRREPLRDVLAFLAQSHGDGLYITGPTGSGKTSLITQVAARLHWPVQSVTCHGRLELQALIGQFTLSEGSMQFVHGPLAEALREGHLLILNEIDLLEPSELSGLNDCLEGQPLVIPQNGGEVIRPHPGFRLIATANSRGSGDRTGLYQGVLRQNIAFLDRFRLIEMDYPDPEAEAMMLALKVPELSSEIREGMIRVAGEIRLLFIGHDRVGGMLGLTLSTRGLLRWAELALTFRGAPHTLAYALDRALTLRAEAEERTAIHRIAADVFGDLWDSALTLTSTP
jgi:cobaltochelatase CobS